VASTIEPVTTEAPETTEAPPPPTAAPPPTTMPPVTRRAPETLSLYAGFSPTLLKYRAMTKVDATLFNSYRVGGVLRIADRLAAEGALLRTSTILFRNKSAGDPVGQTPVKIAPFALSGAVRARLFGGESWYVDGRAGLNAENLVRFRRVADGPLAAHHVLAFGPLAGGEVGVLPVSESLLMTLGGAYALGVGSARHELSRSGDLVLDAAMRLALDPAPFALRVGLESRRQRFTPSGSSATDEPGEAAIDATSLLIELIWSPF
jgi:hypothetical protein